MAKIYASLIKKDKMTIEDVPVKLQEAVKGLIGVNEN